MGLISQQFVFTSLYVLHEGKQEEAYVWVLEKIRINLQKAKSKTPKLALSHLPS